MHCTKTEWMFLRFIIIELINSNSSHLFKSDDNALNKDLHLPSKQCLKNLNPHQLRYSGYQFSKGCLCFMLWKKEQNLVT